MVIITGLGRCGTSILTKYLGEIGFGLGQNVSWNKDIRAGMELSTAYTINHDFYHRYLKEGKEINLDDEAWGDYWKGFTYRDVINAIDKDTRQGHVDIIKDPRITWHPDIIKTWYEVRQDIKIIICHRNINDIMKSRLSLPKAFNDPKPRKKIEDYQIDFSEFYTRVLEIGIDHKILFFPNFLGEFGVVWNILQNMFNNPLLDKFEKGKNIWNELIDYGS